MSGNSTAPGGGGLGWIVVCLGLIGVFLFRDNLKGYLDRAMTRPVAVPAGQSVMTPAPVAPATLPAPQAAAVATPAPEPVIPLPVMITPYGRSDREEATATRGRDGHFAFDTEVNGVHLPMMFDTGASLVTLRGEDAARAGIDVGGLAFNARMRTANGVAAVAPVLIAKLTIGGITRRDVPAVVARPGGLAANLLGQSFMARVAGYNVEGNQLVIRGR